MNPITVIQCYRQTAKLLDAIITEHCYSIYKSYRVDWCYMFDRNADAYLFMAIMKLFRRDLSHMEKITWPNKGYEVRGWVLGDYPKK